MKLEKLTTPGIYKSRGKKATTYVVMYSVRVADPEATKGWHWKPKSRTFDTFQEALTFKLRNQTENRGGQNLEPADLTVEQLCRQWLEYKRPNVKIGTRTLYETHVNNFIVPALGSTKATFLAASAIRGAIATWPQKWNTIN